MRIRSLKLKGISRDYDVTFVADGGVRPLSIVAGAIRTGKTSVLELIDYCLGAGGHPKHREIERRAQTALLELEIHGRPYVIARRLFTERNHVQVHSTSLDRLDDPHAIAKRPVTPPSDPQSLSSFLLEQCGLVGAMVKQAPTQAASPTLPLSFRNLMWLSFLPHTRLDGHVLLHEDNPPEMHTLVQLIEILFEVSDEAIKDAGDRLAEVERLTAGARSEIGTIERFLQEQEYDDPSELDVQIEQLRNEDAGKRDQLRALQASMRAASDYPVQLRGQLEEVTTRAHELAADLRNQETLLERLGPLRAQYAEDLKKLNFLQETKQLLNPIPVVLCPVCFSELDAPEIHDGKCQLCGQQPSLAAPEERTVDVSAELRATRTRLNELNRYFEEIDTRAAQIRHDLTSAEEDESKAQRAIDEAAHDAIAPYLAQRDELTRELGDIRIALQALESQKSAFDGLDERRLRIGRLESEAKRLREKIEALERDRPSRDGLIAELSQRFQGLLQDFGFPELQDAALNKRFVPLINGQTYHQETSGGAQTLISLAWQLTMFERLTEAGTSHPGFLMIDSPQRNLTQRDDPEQADMFSDPAIVERFYEHLQSWLSGAGKGAQLILVDNEPPKLVRHDIVKYYSRRADRPPYGLIEDEMPASDPLPKVVEEPE